HSAAMSYFAATSMTIAIFSTVQVFAWIATLWTGRVVMTTAMRFALGHAQRLRDEGTDRSSGRASRGPAVEVRRCVSQAALARLRPRSHRAAHSGRSAGRRRAG